MSCGAAENLCWGVPVACRLEGKEIAGASIAKYTSLQQAFQKEDGVC